MDATHLFAGVGVADGGRARDWYERLFGRPPDMTPHAREWVWRLSTGASLYVVVDGARAGAGHVTIAVSDLGGELGGLAERGITHQWNERAGQRPPSAVVTDPDGNTITIFQAPAGQPGP